MWLCLRFVFVTPEYPNGIYCYFATVDANWNSAYPYVVGPTFYGVKNTVKVPTITEAVTEYTGNPNSVNNNLKNDLNIAVYPNPANDLIAVQINHMADLDYQVDMADLNGKLIAKTQIFKGSTIAYFNTSAVYAGIYFIKISNGTNSQVVKVILEK